MFALSLLPLAATQVSGAETSVFRIVNGLPAALFVPLWGIMQFGQVLIVPTASVAALALRRRRLALELAMAGGAAYLLALVVKAGVARGRPAALLEDVILREPATGWGFVSGHATVATALAFVVSGYVGPRLRLLVCLTAVAVGVARIYVGAHLPLDVVGGTALGVTIGALTRFAVERVPSRRQEATHRAAAPPAD